MARSQTPNRGKYPQLNLNTAISLGMVMLIVGGAFWLGSLSTKVDAVTASQIVTSLELKDIRGALAVADRAQNTQAVQIEGRLGRIENSLSSILSRMDRQAQ